MAKWKRHILSEHKIAPYEGIYVEGHYVRGYEPTLDETHSLYVLQFDWEKVITEDNRNLSYLQETVRKIYTALKNIEKSLTQAFPGQLSVKLPESISFVHSEELEARYPGLTPKEREIEITRQLKAVFIIGIGHPLPASGVPHDDRAADYDDWWTANGLEGYRGLNGDILIWDEALGTALEISSMGIRVNKESLE